VNVVTDNGGSWYAFPAATEYRGGKKWAKNSFGVNANNADWSASAPKIKRAECLGRLINQSENLDIDALFTDAMPCPDVNEPDLEHEAIQRQ
jgi:hypothetical protein